MVTSIPATTSFFALALYAALGHGASLPPVRRASSSGMTLKGTGTGVRTLNLGGSSSSFSSSAASSSQVSVSDFQDVVYKVDIELGGQTFTVQMDTGSSDLWVYAPDAPITLTNTTDIIATESYGQGVAKGPIVFADFSLGGFNVSNQAFINATSAEDFAFFDQGAVGIMGLAFDDIDLSAINFEIQQAYGNGSTLGRTPITHIFAQNPDAPNSFDIRLDRTGDLDETSTGTLLISDHAPNFTDITSQPKLARQTVGRWTVPLDGMAVNSKPFTFNASSISTVPKGKIGVLLDTGFTFPPLPPAAVDEIYSSIPGAVKFSDEVPQWIVPCNGVTNLTFTLGGNDFPVHPLDLTFVATTEIPTADGTGTQNVTYCYNTYQYLSLDPESFSGFDAVLGDAFLRNVYASFDYGDDGSQPFVQLLSTTDLAEAYTDFNVSRSKALAALPKTIAPQTLVDIANNATTDDTTDDSAVSGAVEASSSGDSGSDASSQLYSLVDKYGPVIIGLLAGNLLVGALLVVIGLVACLRGTVRAGAKSRSIGPSYAPVRFKEAEAFEARDREYHD